MSERTVTRIAVVGLGRMGILRMKSIRQNPETTMLAGILDAKHEVGARYAEEYGVPFYTSIKDLCDAPDVDALWICAPSFQHKEIIFAGAQAKKHIAVEKPVCIREDDICSSYQECERNGVILHCSFQRRFDPMYQKLATAVRAGQCGDRLISIRAIFRDHPSPPVEFLKTGGDPFHDLAVHDIDFIRSLVPQEEPNEVWASGASTSDDLKKLGVLDTAVVHMRYPSGLTVSIELSRHSDYGYDQRCEVFGVNGRMEVVDNPKRAQNDGTADNAQLCHSFQDRFAEAFDIELKHFAASVAKQGEVVTQGQGEPQSSVVSMRDACMATVIAEAARLSAVAGRVVVLNHHDNNTTFSLQSRL